MNASPTNESLEATVEHEQPEFAKAVIATVTGQAFELQRLLAEHPELVQARSRSPHGATLLHYVTANGIEDVLQIDANCIYQQIKRSDSAERSKLESRALAVARTLIDAGAAVDALALSYGGGNLQTPLNLLVSSDHPYAAGMTPALVDLLCQGGAAVDGLDNDSSPMTTAMAFGKPTAIPVLVEHGARRDNILLAAASNDTASIKAMHQDGNWNPGDVGRCQTSWFKVPTSTQEVLELALVFASLCGHVEVVRCLIDLGVNRDALPKGSHMTGTPLQTASLMRQSSVVDALIELRCDPMLVEPRYSGTALGWARHGGDPSIIRKVAEYVPEYLRETIGSGPEITAFKEAVFSGSVKQLADVLNQYKFTPNQLDGPWFYFDAPAVVQAKSNLAMVDQLLDAGADIDQKSLWWAGGFGVLDETDEALAGALMKRGATLDIWSAASLGKLVQLKQMVATDPALVHAPGPDGKRPLHCAKSVTVAAFLVSQGAELNARCIDHNSTPAQYLAAEHPEVARYLVQKGCEADLILAAVLGDAALAERVLDEDPESIDAIVDRKHFPSNAADNIYCWTVGWYSTAHEAAKKFKHPSCVEFLMQRSPLNTRLLNACLLGDQDLLNSLQEQQAEFSFSDKQLQHVAHAARNNRTKAVELMLGVGFPVDARSQHGATPLHWAAFHGNLDMLQHVLKHEPSLEDKDPDFKGTPLDWALQGCQHGWYRDTGDYLGVVRCLLLAGSPIDKNRQPTGVKEIDKLLG